jgi:hypothetical protein
MQRHTQHVNHFKYSSYLPYYESDKEDKNLCFLSADSNNEFPRMKHIILSFISCLDFCQNVGSTGKLDLDIFKLNFYSIPDSITSLLIFYDIRYPYVYLTILF